jgi:uncharacterized repeat protein (TIGR03943 family)
VTIASRTVTFQRISAGRPARLLAASPALLVAILVGKLWLTGTLRYYVNDRTVWIVLSGGVLFALVGAVGMREALLEDDAPPATWRTWIFLIPVLVGLVLPARPLSAISGQSTSLGALQLASHVSSGASGDTFGTWIVDLGKHPDPSWWAGRHATLVGFVAPQEGLPRDGFIVGRYLVTCCVVDATLLGFPVEVKGTRVPAQGAWVQVSGTFGRATWTDPTGQHYPILQHARVGPVSIPSSPYLSPS